MANKFGVKVGDIFKNSNGRDSYEVIHVTKHMVTVQLITDHYNFRIPITRKVEQTQGFLYLRVGKYDSLIKPV